MFPQGSVTLKFIIILSRPSTKASGKDVIVKEVVFWPTGKVILLGTPV